MEAIMDKTDLFAQISSFLLVFSCASLEQVSRAARGSARISDVWGAQMFELRQYWLHNLSVLNASIPSGCADPAGAALVAFQESTLAVLDISGCKAVMTFIRHILRACDPASHSCASYRLNVGLSKNILFRTLAHELLERTDLTAGHHLLDRERYLRHFEEEEHQTDEEEEEEEYVDAGEAGPVCLGNDGVEVEDDEAAAGGDEPNEMYAESLNGTSSHTGPRTSGQPPSPPLSADEAFARTVMRNIQAEQLGVRFVSSDWEVPLVDGEVADEITASHADTDVERDVESAASQTSWHSFTSAPNGDEGHCFVYDTLFKTTTGGFKAVQDVQQFDTVCNGNDVVLRVMSTEKHSGVHELVEIQTETARLLVTARHRVMVVKGSIQQHAPATSVRRGHSVVCGGGVQLVIDVQCFSLNTDVFQITFHPDEPVHAFMPPRDVILSKGHCWARTRRGAHDGRRPSSIPETHDSYM